MSYVKRYLLILFLGYLCFSTIRAVIAFEQSVWGGSYYTLDTDTGHTLYDQYAQVVEPSSLSSRGLSWAGGVLHDRKVKLSTEDDHAVTTYRPAVTTRWQHSFQVWFISSILTIVLMSCLWRFGALKVYDECVSKGLARLRPIDGICLTGLAIIAVVKFGVIDYVALGYVSEGLNFGLNYYAHDVLTGAAGQLTIFPYNPLSLLWMQWLSGIGADLHAIGISIHNYSTVAVYVFGSYTWLCSELTVTFSCHWRGTRRSLFWILLLNPLGIYYALFLGQIDIVALAFVVAGARRLFVCGRPVTGSLLILIGVVFAKPQHMLVFPALLVGWLALAEPGLRRRMLKAVSLVFVGAVFTYWCYTLVPAYTHSLGVNPQAARVGWATWFHLFGNDVVVNRPIAYMLIALIIVGSRVRYCDSYQGALSVVILFLGALTAFFQASYAHTFGLAIFLYPAIMLLCLESKDYWRGAFLWIVSWLVICGWGTGTVGDFTNGLGLSLFSDPRLLKMTILGVNYPSLLATIEASAYMGFGILFVIRLLSGPPQNPPLSR